MKIKIENALILPMTTPEASYKGNLFIDDGKILSLKDIPFFKPDKIIDGTGHAVMPAFVNAHTHLAMVYMRNYKDTQADLFAWLNEIFPIEAKLVSSDLYAGSRLGLAEMIKSGTVTFADMYFFQDQTAKAVVEAGMKANIGFTFFGDLADSKKRVKELLPPLLPYLSDQIKINPAPHAIYTTTEESYRYAIDMAADYNTALNTHLSETKKEVEDCIKEHGTTPAFYMEKLGLFSKCSSILAHGVHLTDAELDMMSTADTSVVHNPSSNCKLGSGVAPVRKILSHNINLAIGTDGASSNNNLNLLKDVNLACLLASVSTGNPVELKPFEALKCATYGGAVALGREKESGTIEKGKDADLIMFDLDRPNTTPVNNIYSAIVYSADAGNIDTVMCRGKILMENSQLTTLDEKQIKKDAQKLWEDIKNR